jgi:hypothetical protein
MPSRWARRTSPYWNTVSILCQVAGLIGTKAARSRPELGSCQANPQNATSPLSFPSGLVSKSGNNLLSRCSHYHRPWMLNGRVRNGNGCGHPGMVTGKIVDCGLRIADFKYHPQPRTTTEYQLAAIRVALCMNPFGRLRGGIPRRPGTKSRTKPSRKGSMRPSAWLLVPVS